VLFSLACASAAAPAGVPAGGSCERIKAACQEAGFVQGGGKEGRGLWLDCIGPIMHGESHPRKASKPLPRVDAQMVAACRAQDPQFGQTRAAAPAPPTVQVASPKPLDNRVGSPPASLAADHRGRVWEPFEGSHVSGKPNVVFILTDDLSLNLVQFMPHVLQMQKDGVTFANYFVTDSLCCPSRSAIFTGRYAHDTGIFKNEGPDGGYLTFRDKGHEQVTFATSLFSAGYRTSMSGKYLNGYVPIEHPAAPGWSFWAVAGNGYGGFNYNLRQDNKLVHYGTTPADYLTDVVSSLGVQFIKQSAEQPFLIEIATFAPHAPYTPAPRDSNAFPGLKAPRTPAYDAAPDASAPQWQRNKRALSAANSAGIDRDFRMRAQSVLAVDAMIGALQTAVAAIGQEKNTYFIFSSDNGYHMGEHRLMPGKMTAYDTDIHVPLVVTGPGVPAGRTVEEIVENIDLCPTFTELAGAIAPPNVDGRSLVPLLHGQPVTDWRTATLVEHHGPARDPADPDLPGVRSGNPPSYAAIRTRTDLYVEYETGEREYHDLVADPHDLHNTFSALAMGRQTALSAAVKAIQNCHDTKSCWEAQRMSFGTPAR
jgi:arylsulfatase A-like enzyme